MRRLIVAISLALVAAAATLISSESEGSERVTPRDAGAASAETAYQQPEPGASIAAALADAPRGNSALVKARHLVATVTVSERRIAPGDRFSVVFNVEPGPGIHVYARGDHDYRAFAPLFEPQAALEMREIVWPPAGEYFFAPLSERVPVYDAPFRVVQPLVLKRSEGSELRKKSSRVTISGALSYQACDDTTCFLPEQVPFKVTVDLVPAALPPAC